MAIFLKINFRFNIIPIKIPRGFFSCVCEIDKPILKFILKKIKFILKYKGTRIALRILEKKNRG